MHVFSLNSKSSCPSMWSFEKTLKLYSGTFCVVRLDIWLRSVFPFPVPFIIVLSEEREQGGNSLGVPGLLCIEFPSAPLLYHFTLLISNSPTSDSK